MSWYHDDELPAGYQDADLELAEMHTSADQALASGQCPHWSSVGYLNPPVYPEQHGLRPGERRCRNCGAVFRDDQDDQR